MGTFRSDESGQIIVIAALLIAVLFVGLALVLNSAIYAENMATRGDTSTAEAMSTEAVTEEHLGHAIDATNYGTEEASYAERQAQIRSKAAGWDQLMGENEAKSGRVYISEPTAMKNGTRVNQSEVGNFMPSDDNLVEGLLDGVFEAKLDPLGLTDRTSWLAAKDVNSRSMEISVADRNELYEVDDVTNLENLIQFIINGNDPFGVVFDDGENQNGVYIVDHNNEITAVTTRENGESGTVIGVCSIKSESATVHLDDNVIVDGEKKESCPKLSFTESQDPHDIYFVGSTNIRGTHQFIVDKENSTFNRDINQEYENVIDSLVSGLACLDLTNLLCLLDDNSPHVYSENPDGGDPYTTTAIYDATIATTYQDDRITYTRNVTYPAAAR